MDALVYVATHLKEKDQQMEFLQKVLYSFVNQGIEGKRAIERKDMFNQLKASSSSFSLGLLLPVLATVSNNNTCTCTCTFIMDLYIACML